MNIVKTPNKQETMTSSELAFLLGYDKSEVNRKVKSMFTIEIDDGEIPSSKDSRGYVIEYHLPEVESNMFVGRWDHTHLRKLSTFWVNKKQQPKLPTTMKEVALLLLQSEEEKEVLQEKNKSLSVVSEKKSLKNYTPTKLLGFLYKEGIVKPDQGLAVSDINEALVYSGYQTKDSFRRSGSTVNSYTLTEKGIDYAIQITSGVTSSCKWVYTITKQQDFIDVLENILSGKYY